MDNYNKGSYAVGKAISFYSKLGYEIFPGFVDSGSKVDLVISKIVGKRRVTNNVQVKFTNYENNNFFRILLKTGVKKKTKREDFHYDFLFVVCSNNDCYSIPAKMITKSRIALPVCKTQRSKYKRFSVNPNL